MKCNPHGVCKRCLGSKWINEPSKEQCRVDRTISTVHPPSPTIPCPDCIDHPGYACPGGEVYCRDFMNNDGSLGDELYCSACGEPVEVK